jgi:hypothetical protein
MNTTSARNQVLIEADPTVPILRITRDFGATSAKLLRTRPDPQPLVRPVGGDEIIDSDGTIRDRRRYVPSRDDEYGFHGRFGEVTIDRIVQPTFDGRPDSLASETRRFEDLDIGRTRLHAPSLVDSVEDRDLWLVV